MSNLIIINEQQAGQRPYIAGLKQKRIGLYADNLLQAKRIAFAHFSPKKREEGYLWVELANADQLPLNVS